MQLLASGYTRDTTFLDYYFDSAYDHLGGGILGGSVVKILGMGFGQIGAWVIIVIAIVISVIVMTQKPILAPIHERRMTTAGWRRSAARSVWRAKLRWRKRKEKS